MTEIPKLNRPIGLPLIILIAVSLSVLGLAVFYPGLWLTRYRALDLPSYYIAGTLVRENLNPYNPEFLIQTAQALNLGSPVFPYLYFPMLAVIFIPLSTIAYPTVQLIWFGVAQLFFWMSVVLLYALFRNSDASFFPKNALRLAIVMSVCGLSFPLVDDLRNGQVNTILLFFSCAFLYSISNSDSDIAGGGALGLVGMLKPQPLILIPYLIFRRRIKCAVSAVIALVVGTGATVAVVGWKSFHYYLTEIIPSFNMVKTSFPPIMIFAPTNQSVNGVINRMFENTRFSQGLIDTPEIVPLLCRIAGPVVLCITALIIFQGRQANHRLLRDCAFLLLTSVLLTPITWDHHLVLIAVTGSFAGSRMLDAGRIGRWDVLLIVFWMMICLPMYPFSKLWTMNRFLALGMSLKGFGLIGLWLAFYVRFYLKQFEKSVGAVQ